MVGSCWYGDAVTRGEKRIDVSKVKRECETGGGHGAPPVMEWLAERVATMKSGRDSVVAAIHE